MQACDFAADKFPRSFFLKIVSIEKLKKSFLRMFSLNEFSQMMLFKNDKHSKTVVYGADNAQSTSNMQSSNVGNAGNNSLLVSVKYHLYHWQIVVCNTLVMTLTPQQK